MYISCFYSKSTVCHLTKPYFYSKRTQSFIDYSRVLHQKHGIYHASPILLHKKDEIYMLYTILLLQEHITCMCYQISSRQKHKNMHCISEPFILTRSNLLLFFLVASKRRAARNTFRGLPGVLKAARADFPRPTTCGYGNPRR